MKKRLFAVFCSFMMLTAAPVPVSAEEDNALWEKFLRYDLCITNYNALTEEEQQLCHFIFDTEQGTEEAIRCERARRTLAHDPDIGERVTLEQLEDVYGIGDWYGGTMLDSHKLIHCVPDIRHLDSSYDGHYDCCDYWLDETGTDFIRVQGGEFDEFSGMEHIILSDNGGEKTEKITCKPLPQIIVSPDENGQLTWELDIANFPDYVFEDGNYYLLLPDGTAVLEICQYAQPDGIQYTWESVPESVSIPDSVQGHTVIAIDSRAFYGAPVCEVHLPETLEYICGFAFEYCHNLKKINFPQNLKVIGQRVFHSDALEEISIDNPKLKIANNTFEQCEWLKTVSLNVDAIPSNSFSGCMSLETVTLGNTVRKLEANAFGKANTIKKLVLPDSVRVLGMGALKGFDVVEIPPGVEIFGALPQQSGVTYTSNGKIFRRTHPLTDPPECVFSENAAIYGKTGSPAEEYANEWGLTFIPLDVQAGTPAGAKLLVCWLAGMPGAEITDPEAYDLNADGILNAVDLSLMKQILSA